MGGGFSAASDQAKEMKLLAKYLMPEFYIKNVHISSYDNRRIK
jgi:hypothetical protein